MGAVQKLMSIIDALSYIQAFVLNPLWVLWVVLKFWTMANS